jgi:superfamily II DNA or RNA helicase
VTGLPIAAFNSLEKILSYQEGEERLQKYIRPDGSVKTYRWDGKRRLLKKNGIFFSGLVPRVIWVLRKWNLPPVIIDMRVRPKRGPERWALPEGYQLRDYQQAAIEEALRYGRGVIDSPPRTGKTIMMAALVQQLNCRTVITAPTEAIARQTYDRLIELLAGHEGSKGSPDDFYLLVGGRPKTRGALRAFKMARVFIATANTAVLMTEYFWKDILCLIVDERHHQASKMYYKINNLALNAYFRWGFTGTNYRSKAEEQLGLEACLGRTVARYSIAEMIDRGVLCSGEVEFWPVDFPGIKCRKFAEAYVGGIVESSLRNEYIAAAAKELMVDRRKVLILVHRIVHGEQLAQLIPGSQFVQGADGAEVRSAVARLDSGELECLIGSPVVGEGLDCPAVDALVYAKGYKARVTHTQDAFRVLTGGQGKRSARIIDFADQQNHKLLEHSRERWRNYKRMGLSVVMRSKNLLDSSQLTLND